MLDTGHRMMADGLWFLECDGSRLKAHGREPAENEIIYSLCPR